MAQAGFTPISLYFSTTAAAVPTSANLVAGELALNTVDEKLYFKNSAGTVKLLASNATSAPVLSFSAGTTGLTPNTATTGAVTLAGTLAVANGGTGLTAGTSGGVLAYTASGTLASSGALTASALVLGGGAGAAPATTTTGTGVVTALGVNTGSAGAFVVNGGALGSPSSVGTMPAFTLGGTVSGGGNQINNVIIGTSTPLAGAFTTVTASTPIGTASGGTGLGGATPFTSGGVVYASSSSALATGSALTFDGTSILSNLNTSTAPRYRIGYNSSTYADWYRDASTGNYTFESQEQGSAFIWSLRPSGGSATEVFRATSTSLYTASGINVGIGTSSPTGYLANKLVVATGTDSNNGITIASASNRNGSIWFADGTTGNESYRGGIDYTHVTDSLYLYSGASGWFQLTSAGNIALGGVTPSAWSAGLSVFEFGTKGGLAGGANDVNLIYNSYYNGANSIYRNTDYASYYQQAAGQHRFYTAPSGTAGTVVSYTQAMTLSASGGLGVGETSIASDTRLHLKHTTDNCLLKIQSSYSPILRLINGGGSEVSTIDATGNNVLTFQTGSTERARIDSSGNFLVGTTTAKAQITADFNGSATNGIGLNDTASANGTVFASFWVSSTSIGTIQRVTTTNAVVYNTTSDYRLKTVTGSVTGQGERIDALKPIDYQWKEGNQQARGFLAHEFQTVYPNSVSGEKDAIDSDGKPVYQGMQAGTAEVIADLVAEIQSLRQRVAQLETN